MPSELSLLEIRDAVDGSADLRSCAVGREPCTVETPSSLHDSWKPLREEVKRYLEERTVEDISRGRETKRKRMARAGHGSLGGGEPGTEPATAMTTGGPEHG